MPKTFDKAQAVAGGVVSERGAAEQQQTNNMRVSLAAGRKEANEKEDDKMQRGEN